MHMLRGEIQKNNHRGKKGMYSLYQVVSETLLFYLFPLPHLLRHTDSGRVLLTILKMRPATIHISPL